MRRILLDLAVTLDGYIEGENGEVDWCIMEPEMNFADFLRQIDTIFYGRKSYELWGEYSPGKDADQEEKELWEIIDSKRKYVFSRTQQNTEGKAIYINDNILEEVHKIKSQPGKDIWLYGGASLITTFVNHNLVDEYRLSVHPIILGKGKPLFIDIQQRVGLKLMETKTFPSGVVQLIYHKIDSNG